ncbi:MAG: 50S ribosomal protein L10 [Nanoarchaeota archaeon]|nr:50S ribosomal protein L10 [Nanoarchaeota archaeon]
MASLKSTKAHVSDRKIKQVSEIVGLIKERNTVLLVSIKDIPASQYQEIVKRFRDKAVVKVPKRSIISRALDSSDRENLKSLKNHVGDSTAVMFSDSDAYDISAELLNKKTPVRAKAGQIAPEDIIVQAGPTELIPGPAITELGALGIQIQIDKGKISIKEAKTIVKEGERISSAAADVMSKLDIKPFSIGFVPLAAFDAKEDKLYLNIEINKEETLEELKNAFGKALPFAVEIGYATSETIRFILAKAAAHGRALEKFETTAEEIKEEPKEEKAEESVKEENSEGGPVENTEEKNPEDSQNKQEGEENGK